MALVPVSSCPPWRSFLFFPRPFVFRPLQLQHHLQRDRYLRRVAAGRPYLTFFSTPTTVAPDELAELENRSSSPEIENSRFCVTPYQFAGLLDRHVQSSKMVHAALLLLMLEAVHTDLVSPSA